MSGLRLLGEAAAWLAAALAVTAHAGLAVLAVAEVTALGWPLPTGFDTVNVSVVLAAAAGGATVTAWRAARACTSSRALRGLIRAARQPVPPVIRNEAAAAGLAGRVEAVAAGEAFAVTYGLARPRILVSTALASELTPAEIAAVLAHEREHLNSRDPLRLLAARLLAGWWCYLPTARWLASRAALRRELAADAAAARSAGRGVLAGALLKLAGPPACAAVAAASPGGDPARSLAARVTQLEGGQPPRRRLAPARVLASGAVLLMLSIAGTCCAAMSQVLSGGLM